MKYIPARLSRVVARQILKTKKHSPSILLVAGTTGMVASTVLACKATLRLEEVLAHGQDEIHDAEMLAAGTHPSRVAGTYQYSQVDAKNDVRVIRIRTGLEIAKLYAPAIGLGLLSIVALTKSHKIMRERNAQLTAAYVAVSEALSEYRKRVRDEVGKDKELELYHGAVESTTTVEDRNGPKKITKKSAGQGSPYAKLFNKDNQNWNKDPMYNLLFLRGQEKFANERLVREGFLLLNDVYEALGMDRTKAGCVVGWYYDPTGNNLEGDNYIDFGVWDDKNIDKFHDFLVGFEDSILVDFNVDEVPVFQKLV